MVCHFGKLSGLRGLPVLHLHHDIRSRQVSIVDGNSSLGYAYDDLNRLKTVQRGSTYPQPVVQSWGLDQLGNWLTTTTAEGSQRSLFSGLE